MTRSERNYKKLLGNRNRKKEFIELTKNLIDILTEFSLLTLRTIHNKKQATLKLKQIEETINFDLQFRLQQINDPKLLDIVREKAKTLFLEEQRKTNTSDKNKKIYKTTLKN